MKFDTSELYACVLIRNNSSERVTWTPTYVARRVSTGTRTIFIEKIECLAQISQTPWLLIPKQLTDRAAAACRRSYCQLLRVEGYHVVTVPNMSLLNIVIVVTHCSK
jgi:hypothetical protein